MYLKQTQESLYQTNEALESNLVKAKGCGGPPPPLDLPLRPSNQCSTL